MTKEELEAIEARPRRNHFRGTLDRCEQIGRMRAEAREFDGDRRGHWGAIEEAVEDLLRDSGINDIPALTAALREAWARIDELAASNGGLVRAHDRLATENERLREALREIKGGGPSLAIARAALSPEEHKG